MSDNADQIAYWNDTAGAKWVANQQRLDGVFAPLTEILLAAAAPKQGEHVLDVGCGCGETSLIAARHVGVGGEVLSVDLSRPMLDHAARRAEARPPGSAPIDWRQADAMTCGFAPEAADLALSRFGVMFFADQTAAFRNIRGALKPGGRFAFLCWRPRAEVEWMQWPLDRLASVLPPPEQTTGQPGPFGLADPVATCHVLEAAGFSAVQATPVDAQLTIAAGEDAVEEAMILLRNAGPSAVVLREADLAIRPHAEDVLRSALSAHLSGGALRFGGACWLYTGGA